MNPKKIWANLAVSDLDRTTKFYFELGFKSNGSSKELTSFFVGDDDFVIHFFYRRLAVLLLRQEIKQIYS